MSEMAILAVLPNILAIAIGLGLAFDVLRRAPSYYRTSIFMVFLLIAVNSFIWAVQRFTSQEDVFMALVVLEYLAEVSLLVALLAFSFQYVGSGRRVTRRNVLLWSTPGLLIVLLNATNGWHHLYYISVQITEYDGISMFHAVYGPLFLLWIIYWSVIFIMIVVMMTRAALETAKEMRVKFWLMIVAILVYVSFGVANIFIAKNPYVSLLSCGLSISAVLIVHAEQQQGVITQRYISIREAIEGMEDGVIVIDSEERLTYANEHSKQILSKNDLMPIISLDIPRKTDMKLATDRGPREYSIVSSPILHGDDAIGRILVFHDITDRREMEDNLADAKHRLETMTKIVRHDIMNDLLVLSGHMELLGSVPLDEKQSERIGKINDAIGNIGDHVKFTGEYQMIGSSEPSWQDLGLVIGSAIKRVDLDGVVLQNDVDGVQVFADPMLPRVFHNLLDNSMRHGGEVGQVRIFVEDIGERCRIIIEDDGEGVPPKDKERIFDSGYGRNTGQGLFLVREILAMTGMGIVENGVPGRGARFEIEIPSGAFRRHGTSQPD